MARWVLAVAPVGRCNGPVEPTFCDLASLTARDRGVPKYTAKLSFAATLVHHKVFGYTCDIIVCEGYTVPYTVP